MKLRFRSFGAPLLDSLILAAGIVKQFTTVCTSFSVWIMSCIFLNSWRKLIPTIIHLRIYDSINSGNDSLNYVLMFVNDCRTCFLGSN